MYVPDVVRLLRDSDKIIIYGARIVAKEVAHCLMGMPYNKEIEAFMVSVKDGNPDFVMGHPVITIEEGKKRYQNELIVVAVLEKYLDEIKQNLAVNGFNNVIYFGFESDLWSGIRGNYYRELCISIHGKYRTLEEEIIKYHAKDTGKVHIYSAKCHVDKEIINQKQYPWEIPIQVGAALTDQVVAEVRDNVGNNISSKNRKYCELTALYWIWKNDQSDYAGLGHYRRHFELTEDIIEKLGGSDIDVILTIPILNFPSVRAAYENDHRIDDWDTMLLVLKELHPNYYESAIALKNGVYYYAYNMLIARKEILDEYCEWLFPILFECEKRCQPRTDKYQERYIGFLSERLMSIFFIHNWERWKIVHAKKNFLT